MCFALTSSNGNMVSKDFEKMDLEIFELGT